MNRRHAIVAGACMAGIIAVWLFWEQIRRDDARDRMDDLLINGAELTGRPEAAETLRQARTDANTWDEGEWVELALAIIAAAIIGAYVGWGFGGPEGAVIGLVLGMAAGAIAAVVGIKYEDSKKRAAAEIDIIIPQVPEMAGAT